MTINPFIKTDEGGDFGPPVVPYTPETPPLYPGDGYGPPEPPPTDDYGALYTGDLYGGNGP
jgi:hypothetical protein